MALFQPNQFHESGAMKSPLAWTKRIFEEAGGHEASAVLPVKGQLFSKRAEFVISRRQFGVLRLDSAVIG